MLTETYLLVQALQRAEIALKRTHPRLKVPGKSGGPCLRVRLDQHGTVASLEPLSDEDWPCWTIMEGKHNSFPVVRSKEPLLSVPPDDPVWNVARPSSGAARRMTRTNPKQLQDALLDAIDRLPVLKLPKRSEDLWKRLRELKAAELQGISHDAPELQPVSELANRFSITAGDTESLMRQLVATTKKQLTAGWIDGLEAATRLLIGSTGATGVQLAFDLDPQSPRIYTDQISGKLAEALPISENAASGRAHPAESCAFTGRSGHLLISPFPEVPLPVLNRSFPLVSMFEEAACNSRYGLKGSQVVPVSEQMARAMQDALTHIVAKEREGKTWRGVASGRFEMRNGRRIEKQDLLIAYVDGKPDLDAPLASLFGTDAGFELKQFEIAAQAVCQALEGIAQEWPDSHLNLFIIREASPGQAQVVLAEAPSVQQVLDAARRWQSATGNIPPIALPIPAGRGQKAQWRAPRAPCPDEVVRLLSHQWLVDGTRASPAPGVELDEVLDLMLRRPGRWERAGRHLLDLVLERGSGLLIRVFAASCVDDTQPTLEERRLDHYSPEARQAALGAASLLGILLHSLGRDKELYMHSPAFLVGRLLALADLLHREYCKHERGGSIPPQLIGNALMPLARDSPEAALGRLVERLPIYKAWADKVDGGEAPLAKWTLRQMSDVANTLAGSTPATAGQTDRAELLLGYIARSSGSAVSGSPSAEDKEANQ